MAVPLALLRDSYAAKPYYTIFSGFAQGDIYRVYSERKLITS
jgi:hypothetical protein